ncbi:hypothetical protein D3C81_1891410 [compost metagenome]
MILAVATGEEKPAHGGLEDQRRIAFVNGQMTSGADKNLEAIHSPPMAEKEIGVGYLGQGNGAGYFGG